MKVIILGAGRVGESVAEHLISEHNDISVIDQNRDLLARLEARFDLRGVQGDCVLPSVLAEAGAADADLLLACASEDATNLAACKTAQQRFGIPLRIVRLHSEEWGAASALLGEQGFGVHQVICPEASVTRYVNKLVEYPEALQVREFAQGLAALVSVRATAGAPLVRRPISEIKDLLPGVPVRVVAIYRRFARERDRFIACTASSIVQPADEVFFLVAHAHIRQALACVHSAAEPVRRMMIAGGGYVGLHLARALQKRVHLKVLERDARRCEYLATQLDGSALILQGDCTDEDLMQNENIDEVDFFCALTNDDENNIMSGLLAKQFGASRVLSLINRRSYADLVHGTQIDIALSPAQAMMGELLAHIRQGDVAAVHSVRRGQAEALEIVARGTPRTSRVVGRRIDDIGLPEGAHIGLIVRGLGAADAAAHDEVSAQEDPQGAVVHNGGRGGAHKAVVLGAQGSTVIEAGDHAIVFVSQRRLVRDVEKLFRVSAMFF